MHLSWVPILLASNLIAAILLSYCVSVGVGHLEPFLPFISDAGVLIPERAVFSQLINMGALFKLVFVYLRYEQAKTVKHYRSQYTLVRINRWSLRVGASVALGLSLVANFQLEIDTVHNVHQMSSSSSSSSVWLQRDTYSTLVQNVHWMGALLAFSGAVVWMALQAWITSQLSESSWLSKMRYTFAVLGAKLFIGGILLAAFSTMNVDDETGRIAWTDSEHSMETVRGRLSMAAAACEWLLCCIIVVFLLSFYLDFRHLRLKRATVAVAHQGQDGHQHRLENASWPSRPAQGLEHKKRPRSLHDLDHLNADHVLQQQQQLLHQA